MQGISKVYFAVLVALFILGINVFMNNSLRTSEDMDISSSDSFTSFHATPLEISGMESVIFRFDHLSFRDALQYLSDNDSRLIYVIQKSMEEFQGDFFFECPPVSQSSASSTRFEYVLIRTTAFASMNSNKKSFDNNLRSGLDVVSFYNLGRDATLVVPNMLESTDVGSYLNLSRFMKGASNKQKSMLLSTVARVFLSELKLDFNRKYWLSTSGLGVPWVHVRIDTVPKYYNYKVYKTSM